VRGKQIEVRHGFVRAGNHAVDLIGFPRQQRRVSIEVGGVRHSSVARLTLERVGEPLDGTEPPRDACREQRVDERECMRK
jgi:hypothetical protein